MIIFEDVSFAYGKRQVLRNVSFTMDFDERVAVLGGSGDGKTTVLKLIMGLIKADSGRILIEGVDITGKEEYELRETRMKFSIVFQEGALFDSLNVKENVAFCLREYTKMSEGEIEDKVREILKTVGVEHALHLMPEELSGGMHRRVAVARSLASCEPRMFLYDEPTTGLDPINADNICNLILQLAESGKGFMIVTHKVIDAMKVADRFMFLKDGMIVLDGNRDELIHTENPDINLFISELSVHL
jgi:phospholipid/cholesterol/gamma-HCH transport system ATP-binding protein